MVLTVGNSMMGDDAAGPHLRKMLREIPIVGWQIVDGGAAPESCIDQVRSLAPEQVVIFDAAEMGLPAGRIRRIPTSSMALPFLITTHTLPLSFLVEAFQEFVPQVDLVGIQPEVVAFGFPLSEAVRQAVARLYETLSRPDFTLDDIPLYEPIEFR